MLNKLTPTIDAIKKQVVGLNHRQGFYIGGGCLTDYINFPIQLEKKHGVTSHWKMMQFVGGQSSNHVIKVFPTSYAKAEKLETETTNSPYAVNSVRISPHSLCGILSIVISSTVDKDLNVALKASVEVDDSTLSQFPWASAIANVPSPALTHKDLFTIIKQMVEELESGCAGVLSEYTYALKKIQQLECGDIDINEFNTAITRVSDNTEVKAAVERAKIATL